eukprot:TRINITY_DN12844_c0_g1_i3.p1 TRINITY_DN12844_c0_g1~~TRINITY_DN12844_c0_g1_i3.p1  ORF type:complete len:357 (-),score=63.56 TRINITY_DN12844_c0_g1_i3:95-1165(-)
MCIRDRAAKLPLIAVSIVERDKHGEALCTWMYPTLGDLEPVVVSRSQMGAAQIPSEMLFSKFKNTWIYCLPCQNSNTSDLPRATAFSVCLLSKVFDPEQHLALLTLMSQLYAACGDPVRLLEGYLSVFAKGRWEPALEGKALGRYVDTEHDHRAALLRSSLIELVCRFGQESIYLWSALMMSKRIVLYSSSLYKLQHTIRAIPLLAWHRGSVWDSIRPFVSLDNVAEIADLETTHFYVAGFNDPGIQARPELYDLFVDADTQNFIVADHAVADFSLCHVHKSISNFLMEAAQSGADDHQALIKGLCQKTKQILEKLSSLRKDNGDGSLTVVREDLASLGKNADVFMYNVAIAEGLA